MTRLCTVKRVGPPSHRRQKRGAKGLFSGGSGRNGQKSYH